MADANQKLWFGKTLLCETGEMSGQHSGRWSLFAAGNEGVLNVHLSPLKPHSVLKHSHWSKPNCSSVLGVYIATYTQDEILQYHIDK